jgi:hypothetical protein
MYTESNMFYVLALWNSIFLEIIFNFNKYIFPLENVFYLEGKLHSSQYGKLSDKTTKISSCIQFCL